MGWVREPMVWVRIYGLSSRPTPTLCPPAWKFLLCIKVDNVNVRPGDTTCWNDNPTSAFVSILPWNITQQINIRHHVTWQTYSWRHSFEWKIREIRRSSWWKSGLFCTQNSAWCNVVLWRHFIRENCCQQTLIRSLISEIQLNEFHSWCWPIAMCG